MIASKIHDFCAAHSQLEECSINENFLKEVPLREKLVAHFIKPWTCPILEQNGISWSEFEAKFLGSDEPARDKILHRKTNPVHFVNMLREGEFKGHCATGYFTMSDVFFVNATRLQVVTVCAEKGQLHV
jgi:hypothetical protein